MNDNKNEQLGDRIYKLRGQTKLSQEEFGKRLGVTRQTISQWEANQKLPRADRIEKLNKVFRFEIGLLFSNQIEQDKIKLLEHNEEVDVQKENVVNSMATETPNFAEQEIFDTVESEKVKEVEERIVEDMASDVVDNAYEIESACDVVEQVSVDSGRQKQEEIEDVRHKRIVRKLKTIIKVFIPIVAISLIVLIIAAISTPKPEGFETVTSISYNFSAENICWIVFGSLASIMALVAMSLMWVKLKHKKLKKE